ncbi:MAG TPA: rhodanese-like domain-containing protein [Mycobacteriales bacterium]|nr:rhodanese-like domain-containing protein [Mycobacteriales bacterium]
MVEVDTAALALAHAHGLRVVDVREPAEFGAGHVPGAENIPLAAVPTRLSEFPRDERVFVVCASGGRSYQAAEFLVQAGVDAVSVSGGTTAWMRAGHPVVVEPSDDGTAGGAPR